MNILVSGSSGLVGSALVAALTPGRHRLKRLIRSPVRDAESEVHWDPAGGVLAPTALEGLDAVVNLAGENIASGRWTAEKKARIRDSRVNGTELLCRTLARLDRPPATLISASAVGYYGDRGDELLTEESPPGSGFLSDVCQEWEAATAPPAEKGIRVVLLRIGVVLTPRGGALAKMLPAFRMGLGGRIGNGRQYLSWITLDDLLGVIQYALNNEEISGPLNAVAPAPVTNHEFTKTLGRVLSRPTIFPLPAFASRLAMGEMADALLLASTRVQPARLQQAGYPFQHRSLDPALRHLLDK